jgi:hypothetical protein
MNAMPIQWDKQEMFVAPNGMQGVRYAISDRDGIVLEFSMHDATIQSLLPRDYWFPVFSTPVNNAKVNLIDGKLVILCGLGKPNDPMGNLILYRVKISRGFLDERKNAVTELLVETLRGFGIKFENNMFDAVRSN